MQISLILRLRSYLSILVHTSLHSALTRKVTFELNACIPDILKSMENQFNNSEKAPVDRQEVLNRLKDYGMEDETTRELLSAWVDQIKSSAETLTDKKEIYKARIENEIAIAKLYIEAGYLEEALDSLNDTGEIAYQSNEDELLAQIDALIVEAREMLDSYYEKRVEQIESLGYSVSLDDGKFLELEKGGYKISLEHFQKPSRSGIDQGRISQMIIGKAGEVENYHLFNSKSEESEDSEDPVRPADDDPIIKIYQELIDNLN